MDLGVFSISLAVKDLEASRSFYEKFGFKAFAGAASQNRLIMKNGEHVAVQLRRRGPGWESDPRRSAGLSWKRSGDPG